MVKMHLRFIDVSEIVVRRGRTGWGSDAECCGGKEWKGVEWVDEGVWFCWS
jgi:hypothetical protein